MRRLFFGIMMCALAFPGFGLDVDADFTTETRARTDGLDYLSNKETGIIGFAGRVDDHLFAAAKIGVRYFNSPAGLASGGGALIPAELSFAAAIGPVEFSLEEAYFTYSDFIVPGLDLTVGKQRINWGTADAFNPTDVLNPLDLSDPFDFGRKIPSLALDLTYTIPGTEVFFTFVAEPYSPLARLNPLVTGGYEAALAAMPGVTGIDANAGTVDSPDAALENGVLAGKFGFTLLGFDLSLCYATRMVDIPLVSALTIDSGTGAVTSYTLSYYREHMAGCDLAKDWGIFLTRAELAVFFQPEQTVSTTVSGFGTTTAVALPADPYVKYVIGLEKDFGGGFYLNAQYAHGFYGERGNTGTGRLQDYLSLRLQLKLLDDKLTFGLTGLLNLNTAADLLAAADPGAYFADHYGVLGCFDVEYKPSLSLSLKTGVMVFEGAGASRLGSMNDYDHVFVSCEVKF
jgi:hypothetical protein